MALAYACNYSFLQVGDKVYGSMGIGSFAEQIAIDPSFAKHIPKVCVVISLLLLTHAQQIGHVI